ncbi:MAG: uracil phosphoribosyltransferase [Caldithrix sp.]|nr:uracil phosphoribosyltransferase [Caldithrix sp.]
MPDSKNLNVLNHPLIQQKLTYLRDKRTDSAGFRDLLNELSALMVYEITRQLPTRKISVQTPLEDSSGNILANPVILVPILRAGLAMCDGILHLIPQARVGHLGLYRDEKTLQAISYYKKFPNDMSHSDIFIIDPMLATGGSAVSAIDKVKTAGGKRIYFVCLVAAPEGVAKINNQYGDIPIYTAALDRELNEKSYILPGLGDAGDRIYGTV